MKKLVALMLAAALLLGLVACGGGAASTNPPETQTPAQSQAPAQTQAPGEKEPEEPGEKPEATEPVLEPTPEATPALTQKPVGERPEMFTKKASIEETVLVNEKDVIITAVKLEYTPGKAELTLRIENNTDKTLEVESSYRGNLFCFVNGCKITTLFNEDVEPGKKVNGQVLITEGALLQYGITEIYCIDMLLCVNDDDANEMYLEPKSVRVTTSEIENYNPEYDTYLDALANQFYGRSYGSVVSYDAENVYEGDVVRVLSQAFVIDNDRPILLIELENTSDQPALAYISDISLNGLAITGEEWTNYSLSAGTRGIKEIDFSNILEPNERKVLGLDSVVTISYSISAKDIDYNVVSEDKTPVWFVNTNAPEGAQTTINVEKPLVYEDDQARIVLGGISRNGPGYIDYMHILLLVQNKTDETLIFGVQYGSLSINEYMIDGYSSSQPVSAENWGLVDISVRGEDLEDCEVEDEADITEVEMTIQIRDSSYHAMTEPVVTITLPLPETNG